MDIDTLIDDLLDREGGYIDHPNDLGGATCWGITERTARRHGYHGAMRALPRSLARRIYRSRYWTAPHFDAVARRSQKLAAELLDTGVNMGPAVASGFLQRALNGLNRQQRDYGDIACDGRIGPVTLNALDSFLTIRGDGAHRVLVKAIDALQGERYLRLAERRPANETFLYGWLANRIG